MNNLQAINKNLTIDSREIAKMGETEHWKLLRKLEGTKDGKTKGYIQILNDHKIVVADYFIKSEYQDAKGEMRPCYLFTKMGCEFIANKFTGEKGVLFTAKYVKRFNEMEKFTQNNFSISEFKAQLVTQVNELFDEKLSEAKEYYKIKAKSKVDISSYIKKRLGILRADDEYEQVKTRIFLLLGITKWEDLNIDNLKSIMPVIDESIRVVKMDRPQQVAMWD